jgi:protein-disulfide isomerase
MLDKTNTFRVAPLTALRPPALAAAFLLALTACSGDDVRAEELRAPVTAATADRHTSAPAVAADTIDLRRLGYAQGAANAPVTVVEFSDFGCPFCAMFAQGTYPSLKRDFVDTGRVRWVYIPFVMGNFPNGDDAARAGECAAEQNRFWEMKGRIYSAQNEWRNSRRAASLFAGYAGELGLDADRFASCYREDRGGERTRLNNRAADALRVRATPSFFINGRLVEGAVPEAQFRQILTRLSEGTE